MKLSIITVAYNAFAPLQETAENILAQTFTDYEYLVIDGGSSDGTADYLEKLAFRFNGRSIPLHFVSEPDHGIYDAMNKGSRMAKGDWILFLNAGDLFAASDVLEKIFEQSSDAGVIYGDTLCVYQGRQKLYPALPLEQLKQEMAFCHQSAFIRRDLMLQHPYDLSYRICADHHLFLRLYLESCSFDYRPMPIAIYEIAGVSDRNKLKSHKEQQRMQKELGIRKLTPGTVLREFKFYSKYLIKSVFGQKLIDHVRKKRLQ